eukprot:6199535-Pleurochrysis_carterae.AAC.2
MCGSCQDFEPTWENLQESVEGLHWGQENVALASQFGVLEEGIPNVKLLNLGNDPVAVLTGDDDASAEFLKQTITRALAAHSAALDSHGFYLSPGAATRTEL